MKSLTTYAGNLPWRKYTGGARIPVAFMQLWEHYCLFPFLDALLCGFFQVYGQLQIIQKMVDAKLLALGVSVRYVFMLISALCFHSKESSAVDTALHDDIPKNPYSWI